MQPNDGILVNPGTAGSPNVATHAVGGKEIQVVTVAGASGHLRGTRPTYCFQTGFLAPAQNKIYFDLFNATGSGQVIQVLAISLQKNMAGITGVPLQFDLQRTTSVGTGTAVTPVKLDLSNVNLPAQVTARHSVTAGAALGDLLISRWFHSEETNVAAQVQEALPFWPVVTFPHSEAQDIYLRENQGLALRCITNTIVGAFNAWVLFTVE